MDPEQGVSEEVAPLVVSGDEAGSTSGFKQRKSHTRDIHILSSAFLFIFSAYAAAQNLESTVNTAGEIGPTSMGILYTSFTLFSLVASPIVRWMGSKGALVLGTSGYLLFIASNLKPSWYSMVPASLYLGFTASIIWVGQGSYLTSKARSHAKDCQLHEGTVIGYFNGEFWGMFASTQVIGNLISLALLRNGEEGETVTGTNLLFSVFLVCMIVGIILMCFLSGRSENAEGPPMAEFTKYVVTPSLGISGVGGAMAVFGASDAICSLLAGRLTSDLSSITLIVSGGSVLQAIVLLWLLFAYRSTSGFSTVLYPLLMAVFWGVGDGVFNTQINALLGMLFKQETEAAFAQLKVWQSGAIAVVFFLNPYISLQAMLIVMVVSLIFALSGFLFLTLYIEKV